MKDLVTFNRGGERFAPGQPKYKVNEDGVVGGFSVSIVMCDERRRLLLEFVTKEVAIANDIGFKSPVASLFSYTITPTTIGEEFTVKSHVTGKVLNLSLVGDEEW